MTEVKKRIVIASILKPVSDTRMTEKIGVGLAETKNVEVHVIGFPSVEEFQHPSLRLHSLPLFRRISFKRWQSRWKVCRMILSLRPDLVIICTHELLLPALFVKFSIGSKIVYDVQENYYRNIRFTKTFPFIARHLLGWLVRMKEIVTAPWIDHFFLAERNYINEFSFFNGRFTVIENKVKKTDDSIQLQRDSSQLLFSGTLAETTGVFIAIDLAIQLHREDPKITLLIIGFCSSQKELKKIRELVAKHTFISIIGGEQLVSHRVIMDKIKTSGAGIICYPPNPSTYNSIPTKLFEYLGYQLPILLIDHPEWTKICEPYRAAVTFNPSKIDAPGLLRLLKSTSFYTVSPKDVFWEADKMIQPIESLLHRTLV